MHMHVFLVSFSTQHLCCDVQFFQLLSEFIYFILKKLPTLFGEMKFWHFNWWVLGQKNPSGYYAKWQMRLDSRDLQKSKSISNLQTTLVRTKINRTTDMQTILLNIGNYILISVYISGPGYENSGYTDIGRGYPDISGYRIC